MCPICKECGENINHLREICSGWQETNVFFNKKKGCIDGKYTEFKGDDSVLEYNCPNPNCEKTLFTNPAEAEEFLREKDELQEIVAEKLKQIEEGKDES